MTRPFVWTVPALCLALALAAPRSATAQQIAVKTVPVAAGDQFLILPSARLGMGGVSIALDDPWLDPWTNPAKGGRRQGSHVFGAPVYYAISDDNGEGRTLPVGALLTGDRWFGGAAFAVQQLHPARSQRAGWVTLDRWAPQPELLRSRSANNLYASGLLGTRLADGRTTVALGASYAGLGAVDGVDLLYAMSQEIRQDGHAAGISLGVLRELDGERTVELLLLHHRHDMTHDVTYLDWVRDSTTHAFVPRTREVRNLDQTHTWGAHLGYVRPLAPGWRLGGIATLNYLTHPKIPNYEIMNIPRDPGFSWAYNLGVGMAKHDGPVTLGVDLIYEPIWSETWADTPEPVRTASGGTIPAGGKTVENEFRFDNALLRMGVEGEMGRVGVQLGLQARAFEYRLEQYDNVRERRREQEESWMEWTPTWSAGVRLPEVELRYAGRMTTGTGRPGVAWTPERAADLARLASFIIAPSGPLTLQEATVLTHQLTVSVPVH